MLDRERLELAAMFAREWVRKFDLSEYGRADSVRLPAEGAIDIGLIMADRLIAACTKPDVVVAEIVP